MEPRALIFDFDGLLIDTEGPEFDAWSVIYEEHGLRLSLRDWHGNIGTRTVHDPLAAFPHLDDAGRNAMRQRKRDMVAKRLMASQPRPGIVELLEDARRATIPMAIASSSERAWVTRWAGQHGILDYFTVLCTREDVAVVKPDPTLYSLAAERLGVAPAHGLALEDSRNGALAALGAGLRCVVYPNPITADMEFPAPCVRVERLEGGLAGLLAQLRAVRT